MYQHTKSFESVKSDMEMKSAIPTSLHVASLGYEDEWCPAISVSSPPDLNSLVRLGPKGLSLHPPKPKANDFIPTSGGLPSHAHRACLPLAVEVAHGLTMARVDILCNVLQ
jgi:hypothetical protein